MHDCADLKLGSQILEPIKQPNWIWTIDSKSELSYTEEWFICSYIFLTQEQTSSKRNGIDYGSVWAERLIWTYEDKWTVDTSCQEAQQNLDLDLTCEFSLDKIVKYYNVFQI